MLPREVLEYDSATKVGYSFLETKPLISYAKRVAPAQDERDGPVIQFNMLHLKS